MERYSGWVIAIAMVYAVALAAALISWDDDRSWWDTESAVTAIVLTAGVLFAYSKVFPTKFFVAFQEVDFATANWSIERQLEISVPTDSRWPIFLVVHNTGISSWHNFRITVEFDNDFVPMISHPTVPKSDEWDWETAGMKFGKNPPWIQIQRSTPLTVGEPQTLRFVLRTPSKTGKYKVGVKAVSDVRIGESEQTLWLNVVDAKPASQLETSNNEP